MEILGCALGLLGAFMLSINKSYSGTGFVFFLASNLCWIIFGVKSHQPAIVIMQAGFLFTSGLGIYRWVIVGFSLKRKSLKIKNGVGE